MQLLDFLRPISERKYVLITGRSDVAITRRMYLAKPPCVVRWFAVNNEVAAEEMVSLPLGVENYYGCERGRSIEVTALIAMTNRPAEPKRPGVYFNCNIATNPPERMACLEALVRTRYLVAEQGLSYGQYLESMSRCMFVASPEGNGHDCHRTWEAMYLRSIPIVRRSNVFKDCADLPMVQIDSWAEVTDAFLAAKLAELQTPAEHRAKLQMKYWAGQIHSARALLQ